MKQYYIILLLSAAITLYSCNKNRDKCGNTNPIEGKYISSNNPNDYIIIKKDHTYINHFRYRMDNKIKEFTGEWKFARTGCEIILINWKDTNGQELIPNEARLQTATFEDDVIAPYTASPRYTKEKK